jgi:hypothetical protein
MSPAEGTTPCCFFRGAAESARDLPWFGAVASANRLWRQLGCLQK